MRTLLPCGVLFLCSSLSQVSEGWELRVITFVAPGAVASYLLGTGRLGGGAGPADSPPPPQLGLTNPDEGAVRGVSLQPLRYTTRDALVEMVEHGSATMSPLFTWTKEDRKAAWTALPDSDAGRRPSGKFTELMKVCSCAATICQRLLTSAHRRTARSRRARWRRRRRGCRWPAPRSPRTSVPERIGLMWWLAP